MEQIPTGISGLDELLVGGFPRGRSILVVGSPGSGKTTFAMQYLCKGALDYGERGLFITLDEKPEHIKTNLASFGWNFKQLEKEGALLFIDASPFRRPRRVAASPEVVEAGILVSTPELTLNGLIRTIGKLVEEEDIKRIVVDPITSFVLRYDTMLKRRRAMLFLFDALAETGCTSIIITELRTNILDRTFQLEEFLSQGVILLHTFVHEGNVIRAIQIEKMRGVAHDHQLRPYQIATTGIEVFPKDKIF